MSKPALPFAAHDMSALARSLKDQLAACEGAPGHVELLNMLARSVGCRNFQHFRAQSAARERLEAAPAEPPPDPADPVRVMRLARYFDAEGQLQRWPSKASHQEACLWVLWSRLPAGRVLDEPQVNRLLQAGHRFGDHALLRRWLCDYGMVARTVDGREYRRVERRPPADARALIHHVRRRDGGRAGPAPRPAATA
ncbi:DUF2087 domain-containing protein [Azospirillum sp. ST 5-10]|uniref:DUF2087 domain-containing protein n=1 Tax=unclassified Azospirillum TaxID=2630922 RepID=UPI003F49FA52